MNTFTLILRSFAYHRRAHLGTLLASAVGTAVLVGALLVGDSVRHSLYSMAVERLGTVNFALVSGDRFFKADLDGRLSAQLKLSTPAQSILLIEGVAVHQDKNTRANQVQLVGVQDGFWKLGTHAAAQQPARGEAVINQRLAEKINVGAGSTLLLRIYKPGMLPHDAPLGSDEKHSVVLRVTVKEVLPDRGLGRFSLNANQVAPYNVFLPLDDLQQKLEQPGRANVLLVPQIETAPDAALQAVWSPDDAQLRLRSAPALGFVEISTPRVFLDEPLTTAFVGADKHEATAVTTYFVNAIRANGKETPYSMVAAGEAPLVDADLKENEIVLNQWTAEDLAAEVGDAVELEYFSVGHQRKLQTNKAQFVLKAIVPMAGLHADRDLMPDFPGIKDVDTTHDWDSSIPIDMKKIRPKDEDYWKKYRGTPKAFIALRRGAALWQNRFGTYTALRFPIKDDAAATQTAVETQLRAKINPASVGLQFMPVKQMAFMASAQAIDFSGLFIGFSFFLILSATLLMVLLFQFSIESRASENGILLALGFTPRHLRRVLWAEGTLVAAAGALLGVLGGAYYARFLLENLSTRWRSAVNTSALEYHAEPQSFVIGFVAAIALASFAILWGLRRQTQRSARELLASKGAELSSRAFSPRKWQIFAALTFVAGAAILISTLSAQGVSAAGAFFGAGALFLLSFMALARLLLHESRAAQDTRLAGGTLAVLGNLGVRATARRHGRSMATVALLACGSFLIVAVGANRLDENATAHEKTSGTGGFALVAQSTIPILEDLNTPTGRANAGVPDAAVAGATIHAFRVKAGDDASCLNLNRAQRPRILGVPGSFIERGGFTVAATNGDEGSYHSEWSRLTQHREAGVIPAIADFQSLTWALGLKVGDTITIPDERGNPRKIQFIAAVANSILQGSVLISEDDFVRLYPSESGYRFFLIDAEAQRAPELAQSLSNALQDEGFDAIPAAQRLSEFNAVQNTYLATFAALGGLGLLLGSLGLGVVVLRNVLERRAELALLQALGYSRGHLGWLIFSEHGWLLLLGIVSGVLSAAVAVIPSLQITSSPPPWGTIGLTLLAVALCGTVSALLATWFTLRGPLLAALRND